MKIKLQEILDIENISIYSLSKSIGVSQNNLTKIIKGETTSIKYDILEKLCLALHVTPNEIFEIEYPNTAFVFENNYFQQETKVSESLSEEELQNWLSTATKRFSTEILLAGGIGKLIDKLLKIFMLTVPIDDTITEFFQEYNKLEILDTNIKVASSYRVLVPFLSKYQTDNGSLLDFLTKIKNIYTNNNDLSSLTDDEVYQLKEQVDYYLDNTLPISSIYN